MTNKATIILSILIFNVALSDSMNFVGDMMFGRRYYCTGANSYNDNNQDLEDNLCSMPEGFCEEFGSPGIIPNCGYDILLNGVTPYFQNSYAINVGNLEAVITDSTLTPHPGYDSCKIILHSCPEILNNIDEVNFDYLNLGNNHVLDYMEDIYGLHGHRCSKDIDEIGEDKLRDMVNHLSEKYDLPAEMLARHFFVPQEGQQQLPD